MNHHIHRSRSTEHANAHKDSYEIRDNLHRSSKTFLRSLDKCIIYIHFLPETSQDEAEDDAQKITDKAIKDIDGICAAKEKEIMEV